MNSNLKLEKRAINGVVYVISPIKKCNFNALIFEPTELSPMWKVEINALIIVECDSYIQSLETVESYFNDYVMIM